MSAHAPKQSPRSIDALYCRGFLNTVLEKAEWEVITTVHRQSDWLETTALKKIGDEKLQLIIRSERPNKKANYHFITSFKVSWVEEVKHAKRVIGGSHMLALLGKGLAYPSEVPVKGISFAIEKPVDYLSLLESYDRVARAMRATTLLS